MVLGARTLGEVAMSLSMMAMFPDISGVGRAVRDHCASTAALVRVLSLQRANAGTATYIIGLLHDFGKLLLLQAQPATYIKIHGHDVCEPDTIHVHEREVLGYDHAVLGAHMLRTWGLPDPVPKVIAWHHQPTRAYAAGGDVALSVALIRLAERIDHTLRTSPEPTDDQFERLAATTDCQYLGFKARDFQRFWNDLRELQHEAEQIFKP
jgi:putative nucleotidyltransferase with HDIG domain